MPQANTNFVSSKSARRETQREYETTLILRPSVGKAGITALVEKVTKVFDGAGGQLQRVDNWGLRTLAYPIRRNKQGIYLYARFLGGSDVVMELERNFKIYEEVLRYLTILIDEDVDPSARPTEMTEELLDAASESSPDPVEEQRKADEARAKEEAERQAAEREAAAAAAAVAAAEREAAAAAAAAGESGESNDSTAEDPQAKVSTEPAESPDGASKPDSETETADKAENKAEDKAEDKPEDKPKDKPKDKEPS